MTQLNDIDNLQADVKSLKLIVKNLETRISALESIGRVYQPYVDNLRIIGGIMNCENKQ